MTGIKAVLPDVCMYVNWDPCFYLTAVSDTWPSSSVRMTVYCEVPGVYGRVLNNEARMVSLVNSELYNLWLNVKQKHPGV